MTRRPHHLAAALALLIPAAVQAQLAVSANDGKQLRPGELPTSRTPDAVSVIDLGQSPPRVIGTVAVPTSMIGPPTSVAVASDESFAIVTAAQALEGGSIVKGDTVSVIDLADPKTPRVIQTLAAGSGATGVAINKARTLALVANTGDDSITVFTIRGKRLTPAGRVRLDYQSRPTDIAFSPDGKAALAVTQSASKIVRLAVDGARVTRTGIEYAPGMSPYGVVVGRSGKLAINTNLGGRAGPSGTPAPAGGAIGTVSVIDLDRNEVASSVEVGMIPEHVELSPDGAYVAVVVANGSAAAPGSPNYNPHGLLQVHRLDGLKLVPIAEAKTGQWCQGAAWSRDNRQLLLQCAMAREIELYRFDGRSLTRAPEATIKLESRPGALGSALSR